MLLKLPTGPGQRPEKKTDRRLHAGSRASRSTPSHKASSVNPFEGASELGGGQLPLKSDEGQNPAPGASQAVVMNHY